jgi:hypothetical protein
MGSFKQHITCSTATGVIGAAIAFHCGFSVPTCALSAGLCAMAGMLPDVDSDTSRSFKECIFLAAGLSAVLIVHRLREYPKLPDDIPILCGAVAFLLVRFVGGYLIRRATSHRGMFHSIPAAFFSGQIIFFLATGTVSERFVKGFALTAGYLSHLILDEICSIDSTGKTLRLKKSFGTALKLYSNKHVIASGLLYLCVASLAFTAIKDPTIIEAVKTYQQNYAVSGGSSAPELTAQVPSLTTQVPSLTVQSPPTLAPISRKYSETTMFSRDASVNAGIHSDCTAGQRDFYRPPPYELFAPSQPQREPAQITLP